MPSQEIIEFIRAYSPQDEERICFAWNGKHGQDFEDSNATLRGAVYEAVLSKPEVASLELLLALFRAETECAREAWGVRSDLNDLGALLLTRGGTDVVVAFLTGRAQCFDTALMCASVKVDAALAEELRDHCAEMLATAEDDQQRMLAGIGVEQFEALARS